MNLIQHFLVNNECYKINQKHEIKKLMLHSTGANNPNLNRYVDIGDKYSSNHWNKFRPNGRQVCVHGFIGKLEDGTITTIQTLPWNIVGWHSGKDKNGSANLLGYIGVEICEDDLTDENYFNIAYKEAVELFANLCHEYKLNPMIDIICHSEGYKLGIASNHADVMHWFSKFNKDMDMFRYDVSNELKKLNTNILLYRVQVGAFSTKDNAEKLVEELQSKGYSAIISVDKKEPVIDMSLVTKQIREEIKDKIIKVIESEV